MEALQQIDSGSPEFAGALGQLGLERLFDDGCRPELVRVVTEGRELHYLLYGWFSLDLLRDDSGEYYLQLWDDVDNPVFHSEEIKGAVPFNVCA